MARIETYRKWLTIVGRQAQCLSVRPSNSPAFYHSNLVHRKLLVLPWVSVDHKTLCTKREDERVKSVSVEEAYQFHKAGHCYLDVRSREEFESGHTNGAINIPYLHLIGSEMKKNPSFVDEVSLQLSKCDKVIVGCRSGKRSLMAATDLVSAGYSNVTDIAGGYEAWTQNGLPTHNSEG